MVVRIRHKSQEEREADKAAADAVRAKVAALGKDWSYLVGQLQKNWSAMQDAIAAARLFDVEIELPHDYPKAPPAIDAYGEIDAAPSAVQRNLFESAEAETTIRERVLDELKKAGSKGIKASTIRRIIEAAIGRELHYKTVGMTLYRLSERGLAKREGYTWFMIPHHGGGNENPGVVSAGAIREHHRTD